MIAFIIGKTKGDDLEKRNGVKKHNLRKNETVLKNDTQTLPEEQKKRRMRGTPNKKIHLYLVDFLLQPASSIKDLDLPPPLSLSCL
jgi:wobble nucleotide-excising tRNase